jgi:hypothetical protein
MPGPFSPEIHQSLQDVFEALAAEGLDPPEQIRRYRRELEERLKGLPRAGGADPENVPPHVGPNLASPGAEANAVSFLGTDEAMSSPAQWTMLEGLHEWYVWWRMAKDDEFWDMLVNAV